MNYFHNLKANKALCAKLRNHDVLPAELAMMNNDVGKMSLLRYFYFFNNRCLLFNMSLQFVIFFMSYSPPPPLSFRISRRRRCGLAGRSNLNVNALSSCLLSQN
jgi:hypothetical protein